jgi:hypothetical protein
MLLNSSTIPPFSCSLCSISFRASGNAAWVDEQKKKRKRVKIEKEKEKEGREGRKAFFFRSKKEGRKRNSEACLRTLKTLFFPNPLTTQIQLIAVMKFNKQKEKMKRNRTDEGWKRITMLNKKYKKGEETGDEKSNIAE